MGSELVMLIKQQQVLANTNTAKKKISNSKILQIFKKLTQTEFLSQA